MGVSKKARERMVSQLKHYRAILIDAKNRDINESDTVIYVTDMLSDIFGYKKISEITSEFRISGKYVDLAIKINNDIRFLIEVKAIGVTLNDTHVKQVIDYGANAGIEWVLLTNGISWRIYKIQFSKPISKVLIYEFDLLATSARDQKLMECLENISSEGFTKSSMATFCQQQQILSRFSLAAMLTSTPVLEVLKREIKKISSYKTTEEHLKELLQNEVLKRELVDSEEAKLAISILKKAQKPKKKNKVISEIINKPDPVF